MVVNGLHVTGRVTGKYLLSDIGGSMCMGPPGPWAAVPAFASLECPCAPVSAACDPSLINWG